MALNESRVQWMKEFVATFQDVGTAALNADKISKKSYDFACDQVARFNEWGSRMFLSEKQESWLKNIYEDMTDVPLPPKPPSKDLDDDIPF